jgi:hypothetical protein
MAARKEYDGENEAFLSRWSRRKREAEAAEVLPPATTPAVPVAGQDEAPALTPLDQLNGDSDYRDFFHPRVDEDVRRSALKKLFSDPRYNLMDGLDTYIDDYSKTEPIPPEMLAGLLQAQKILKWASEKPGEHQHEGEAAEPPVAIDGTGPPLAATPSAEEGDGAPASGETADPPVAQTGNSGLPGDVADPSRRAT